MRQFGFRAVQRDDFFSVRRTANDDFVSCKRRQIKRMQRVAIFQHDEVRDIDHVVDGTQANSCQPFHHPFGRRADFHASEHTGDIPWAEFRLANFNGREIFDFRVFVNRDRRRGMTQFATRLRGCLAGDTDVRQPVRTVRRDFPIDHAVALIEIGQRRAKRCVVGQNQQTSMIIAQAQFACRAKHAVGFDAAQLRFFDFEFAEIRADSRAGDALSGVAIRCAADDLQWFAAADVHFADAHVIRIRMWFA